MSGDPAFDQHLRDLVQRSLDSSPCEAFRLVAQIHFGVIDEMVYQVVIGR